MIILIRTFLLPRGFISIQLFSANLCSLKPHFTVKQISWNSLCWFRINWSLASLSLSIDQLDYNVRWNHNYIGEYFSPDGCNCALNLFKSRGPGNHGFVLWWKKRFVTQAMIMYNLSCIWIIDTEYCPLSCIDLYNCESDFNWCFNADFCLFFFQLMTKLKT